MANVAPTETIAPAKTGPEEQPRLAALLDLENLLHPSYVDGPQAIIASLATVIATIDDLGLAVQLVGACNQPLARTLLAHPQVERVRLLVHKGGPDAADRLLLERAGEIPASTELVVIGSGDGGFAMTARRLAQHRHVVVLGRPTSTSSALRRAAHRFVPLPSIEPDAVRARQPSRVRQSRPATEETAR